MKFVPLNVRTNAGPPAGAEVGLMLERAGVPPPMFATTWLLLTNETAVLPNVPDSVIVPEVVPNCAALTRTLVTVRV